jgi:hypothetical protein
MEASADLLYICPHDLPINSNIKSCDIIAKAIQRYQLYFFPPAVASNVLKSLTLNIPNDPQCEETVQLESNESC